MNGNLLFHLGFDAQKYRAKFAIVPGAPERVPIIAQRFSNCEKIVQNREYLTYIAKTDFGDNVFICSTGIGGPSTAIAVHELHMAGADTFIRPGTCGGISTDVSGGDLVIAMSAVRQEGTTLHYAPVEYPATADFSVVNALKTSADLLGVRSHVGVVQSKDSFYGQHDPDSMPVCNDLHEKWEAWKRLNVLCSEMECATLFTVAASLNCRAGGILHTIWNQERKALGLIDEPMHDTENLIKCTINAINLLSKQK